MRIAVIGSNSFSGSDFIDLVMSSGQHEILGISRSPEKSSTYLPYLTRDRTKFQFVQADLNDPTNKIIATLDAFEPDVIVNYAAQSEVGPSWQHPDHWFQTNTVALARLLNELRRREYLKRYVHISSPEVYGTCAHDVLEDQPMNPSTPYAASKAAADMLIQTYIGEFGFPALFIRATNVYGAHQQLFKIIPRSVIYMKLDRVIELHGGGKAVKSYIHIRDVSEGIYAAAADGRIGETYHFSPDGGHRVCDVVRHICERVGKEFDNATRTVEDRPGQDAAYLVDSQKARGEFGWKPKISLPDGISQVVDWIDSNWTEIAREPLDYEHKA